MEQSLQVLVCTAVPAALAFLVYLILVPPLLNTLIPNILDYLFILRSIVFIILSVSPSKHSSAQNGRLPAAA